jgi:CheY-like chemotaxis protein
VLTNFRNFEQFDFKVTTDRLRLQQVLTNLLSNSLKHAKKGAVTIKLTPFFDFDFNRWRLRVQVRDHGVGISQTDQLMLFKLFGNLESKQKHQGVGLGLVISKCIVEEMKGEIQVFSKPRRGCLVQFNFLLQDSLRPNLFLEDSRSIESEDEDLLDSSEDEDSSSSSSASGSKSSSSSSLSQSERPSTSAVQPLQHPI